MDLTKANSIKNEFDQWKVTKFDFVKSVSAKEDLIFLRSLP